MLKFDHFWLIAIALYSAFVVVTTVFSSTISSLAVALFRPLDYYGPEEIETRHFHEFSF